MPIMLVFGAAIVSLHSKTFLTVSGWYEIFFVKNGFAHKLLTASPVLKSLTKYLPLKMEFLSNNNIIFEILKLLFCKTFVLLMQFYLNQALDTLVIFKTELLTLNMLIRYTGSHWKLFSSTARSLNKWVFIGPQNCWGIGRDLWGSSV